MRHEWRGWLGGLGLLGVLAAAWAYVAIGEVEPDVSEPPAPAVDTAEAELDTTPLQGPGVLPEGSLDLNFDDPITPLFIEVSQASGLRDGDRIQLLGTFTDIMNEPPQTAVLQCVDDGGPGVEDCDVDRLELIDDDRRRFQVAGYPVMRELQVSDGRVFDCADVSCYLVIADVPGARAIAAIRLSFGG